MEIVYIPPESLTPVAVADYRISCMRVCAVLRDPLGKVIGLSFLDSRILTPESLHWDLLVNAVNTQKSIYI